MTAQVILGTGRSKRRMSSLCLRTLRLPRKGLIGAVPRRARKESRTDPPVSHSGRSATSTCWTLPSAPPTFVTRYPLTETANGALASYPPRTAFDHLSETPSTCPSWSLSTA